MLIKVNDNATYHLIELDGMSLAIPIATKENQDIQEMVR